MSSAYFNSANDLTVFVNANNVSVVSITFDTCSNKFVLFYNTL